MIRNTVKRARPRGAAHGATNRGWAGGLLFLGLTLAIIIAPGPAALACTQDLDCDDGVACNGAESCDVPAGTCQPGVAVDCSLLADPCNDAACVEPGSTCAVTPKVDGFRCDDGYRCTSEDACQSGVCVGGGGGDSDGDGYCDSEEVQVGCDPEDVAQIPAQPNLYSGGSSANPGEILLTFRAPGNGAVGLASDSTCTTTGECNVATNFCASGRIADPCASDSDCNQAAGTCRIVVTYGSISDLLLSGATLKIPRRKAIDIQQTFDPLVNADPLTARCRTTSR